MKMEDCRFVDSKVFKKVKSAQRFQQKKFREILLSMGIKETVKLVKRSSLTQFGRKG
jgi:hypothetical protein